MPISLFPPDKRQHQHPRSGPSPPLQYAGVGGQSSQGSGKPARYRGDRRWSGQRNKSPRQEDNGRDGLKETENVCTCSCVCVCMQRLSKLNNRLSGYLEGW
jgi:hypothetical protein